MITDQINILIMDSMKSHDTVRTETLRSIKTSFLNWKTSKENVGKTLDESVEIQILNKMVKQRQESIDVYKASNRNDLADYEQKQLDILKEFLPKPATEEDIQNEFIKIITETDIKPVKSNMGNIIKLIKVSYPNADGKLVAQIVMHKISEYENS